MLANKRLPAAIALFGWGCLAWLLLTWTLQAEQLIVGALASVLLTVALLPMMDGVIPAWAVLDPRRLVAIVRLVVIASARIVTANARLTLRIWRPSRPLSSGMVVIPTRARTDAELAGVGLISSLIVDNQLVDLDRSENTLQYHAIDVPPPGEDRAAIVTAGTERLVLGVTRR